eukprot:TRINITY_DN13659_c0_g2_i1.p1 TRINITY_DN13659_c0_g2~~TRINITY_DN13659_c0_g2_i1.p1  ORF type:complete len:476 (+),score=74.29 TRINITY_DN13659_c0_g2_i1:54-1481(+)
MGAGASSKVAEALGDTHDDAHVVSTVSCLSVGHRSKLRVAQHADRQEAVCDDGHPLSVYTIPCSGFCCDRCGDDLQESSRCWRTRDGITIGVCCSLPLPSDTPADGEPMETLEEEEPAQEVSAECEECVQQDEQLPQQQFIKIEGPIELEVHNLVGLVCQLKADSSWTMLMVKDSIQAEAEIDAAAQRLICNATLLEDDDKLGDFGEPGEGNSISLTLLKRSELQVEWLRKVRDHPDSATTVLTKAPPEVRADRFVVLAAVKQNAANLEFADESLKADPEVIRTAMKNDYSAHSFIYAADSLRKDRNFVLELLEVNSRIYGSLSEELRGDIDIARLALTSWGMNLISAPQDIVDDAELSRLAIKNGFVYERAPNRFKDNFWLAYRAACENPAQLRWVPSTIKADRMFAMNLVLFDGQLLAKLPGKHLADPEVVKNARENGFRGEDRIRRRSGSGSSPRRSGSGSSPRRSGSGARR